MIEVDQFVQFDSEVGKGILYEPCKRVLPEDITTTKIQALISAMAEHMDGVGIGLAANQIGSGLQVFMIEYHPPAELEPGKQIFSDVPYQVFINPRITAASEQRVSFWHGCLSAIGHPRGEVATYKWIDIEAFDEKGNKIETRIRDFAAVIFQHEFRHLLGSIYLNHAQETLDDEQYQQRALDGTLKQLEECDESVPLLLSDYNVGETIEEYAQRTRP